MRKFTALFLSALLALPLRAEGLKEYKSLKHRPVVTDTAGKAVERPCTDVYVENCVRNCTNETCRAQCSRDAGPYCQARQRQRAEESAKIALYLLLLASGPLLTLIDGPRNYDGGGA